MLTNKPAPLKQALFATPYAHWRMISIIVVGGMFLATLISCWFIYNHVYATIADKNLVIILNASGFTQPLDLQGYQRVKEALARKEAAPASMPVRNIFRYAAIAPVSTAATTTTTTPEVIPASP